MGGGALATCLPAHRGPGFKAHLCLPCHVLWFAYFCPNLPWQCRCGEMRVHRPLISRVRALCCPREPRAFAKQRPDEVTEARGP